MKICPECKSKNVEVVKYLGASCLVCKDCGYDERDTYDVFADERSTQREKRRYTPYRAGGGRRTSK